MKAEPRWLIANQLNHWPEDIRNVISNRIDSLINLHYRKEPGVPIPMDPAGLSGISWKFLYQLAVRGDMKGRKQPKYAQGLDEFNRQKALKKAEEAKGKAAK